MALLQQHRLKRLRRALVALRVWEAQAQDLEYPEGDSRGQIPDAEQPPEYMTTLAELQSSVTYEAARYCGESHSVAATYSDTPRLEANPYNVECVRLALAIAEWKLP